MKRHSPEKNLGALLLCLLLGAVPALADTPDFDIPLDGLPTVEYHPTITLGDPVIILNQEAYATPLLSVPSINDLKYPMSLCPNGVEAHEIERAINGFVRVAIGGDGLNAGISGYIQEAYIAPADTAADQPPAVTLRAVDGEDIPLLLDYAEGAAVVARYPAGTEARLLGWLDAWCQVQVGEDTGFLPTAQVEWSEEVEQGLHSVVVDFDTLTAEEKHAMDILQAYYREKEAVQGPYEGWSVEDKAEYAALTAQLTGRQVFDLGFDILPGPEDLTQEEAMAVAAQAIEARYGIPPEELAKADVEVHFYDSNYDRTGHHWFFFFKNMPTHSSIITIVSSPEGAVVEME